MLLFWKESKESVTLVLLAPTLVNTDHLYISNFITSLMFIHLGLSFSIFSSLSASCCWTCSSFAFCRTLCLLLIISTPFMRILLNIWPLNGIRASELLPFFTIIKRRWSFLALQIHLLFMPLCFAVSITWHAKRTPFSWQMQKGNDLSLIYLFTLHLSSPSPPHLHHCTGGGFLISCMKTMPLLFWLHLPNKPPAARRDRWPPIITECLIDPRSVSLPSRSIRHACNVCWSQVTASAPPWCSLAHPPARWPWGSLDEWLSLHICTPPRHGGVIESLAGVSERWPGVSILLITIPPEFYDAPSLSVTRAESKWAQDVGGGGRGVQSTLMAQVADAGLSHG